MKIQELLRLEGLPAVDRYKIKATRSTLNANLILFKYSQIESPFSEPAVKECRGLILDETDNWNVVSRSFDKFFNFGESYASKIDWSSAKVLEKLDGSLCVLYNYNGNWRVQTSGEPDAAGEVWGNNFTFSQLFWCVFSELGYKIPTEIASQPAEDFCLSFELMTKYNKVVIAHPENNLVLIGIRNKKTGQEHSVEELKNEYRIVKNFPLYSFEDIKNSFKEISPLRQEGYVIVDKDFNRNKGKHPGYVAIHNLKDGFGPRRLVEILLAGESSEFTAYFPEWKEKFEKVENSLNSLCSELEEAYEKLKGIASQKEFAIEAMKTSCGHALFALRSKRVSSVREFISSLSIDSAMQLLGVK